MVDIYIPKGPATFTFSEPVMYKAPSTMASTIRTIALAAAAVLFWQGYHDKPAPVDPIPAPVPDKPEPAPTPDENLVIRVITEPNEPFPSAPTNPAVQAAVAPVRSILKDANTDDSIKLARAFRSWSNLLGRSQSLKDRSHFHKSYVDSMTVLLKEHPMVGKYRGLDTAVDATIRSTGLTDEGPWDDVARGQAVEAFDALSYQCFQSFLEAAAKSKQ